MSSSRRVDQNEINSKVQLESPTLLKKLDQLSAQMEIAFPSSSSKKDAEQDEKISIKQNQQKIAASLQPLLNKVSITTTTNVRNSMVSQSINNNTNTRTNENENKENIDANEKTTSIDDKINKQINEPKNFSIEHQLRTVDSVKINNDNPVIRTIDKQNSNENTLTTQTTNSITNSSVNTVSSTNVNITNASTSNKHLSAWKRTKILSKTLSSMKSKTLVTSAQNTTPTILTTTNTNQQMSTIQNSKLKTEEIHPKKLSSGNVEISDINHHLNSPLNQIKRRSQEEVSSSALSTARLSSSLSSSCQTSIQNLNETSKLSSNQVAIQAALNNLNQNTGAHFIPDNYNTTIINQLNKNYLKNIQKQKARSDWKSLKSKLIGLGKKESDENVVNENKTVESTIETGVNSTISSSNTNQRKLSNSNQPSENDGIICKKEDLLSLLRNSNLKNKQRRSNKTSIADVVLQLQENKVKDKINQNKIRNDFNEKKVTSSCGYTNDNSNNQNKTINFENSSISTTSTAISSSKNRQALNGRVQFALSSTSSDEQNTPTCSTPPTIKIKSSLKKTTSATATSLLDKNNLIRQTKSNTINNSNLHKKKVKIFETDQGNGIRKALVMQSVKQKDRNNNNQNLSNDEEEIKSENQIKVDDDDSFQNEEHLKVKWDDSNIVDAALLGDAIEAFLSSITTHASTNSTSFSSTTPKNHITSEKKVSFKK